ncbi:MAG TPA: hemin uptake protein HemP [Burkholderiales bacterium]|nr:hemin uptake protein HemP [Burkholderiales bacterium]
MARALCAPPQTRPLKSEELLGRAGHVVIVHNGREYRLRVTQNGKLHLIK